MLFRPERPFHATTVSSHLFIILYCSESVRTMSIQPGRVGHGPLANRSRVTTHERDPLLKPFARSASIYPGLQVFTVRNGFPVSLHDAQRKPRGLQAFDGCHRPSPLPVSSGVAPAIFMSHRPHKSPQPTCKYSFKIRYLQRILSNCPAMIVTHPAITPKPVSLHCGNGFR
jgi:hypothetical protein